MINRLTLKLKRTLGAIKCHRMGSSTVRQTLLLLAVCSAIVPSSPFRTHGAERSALKIYSVDLNVASATGSSNGNSDRAANAHQVLETISPSITSCEVAIEHAERKLDLPEGLLLAMGKVEAQYAGRVWPWSLNVRGEEVRHESYSDALAHLRTLRNRGVDNIDVGCLQLNLFWVARGMPLEKTLDPVTNALTAGFHLRDLRQKHRSWSKAVALYHSRRSRNQQRYQCRVGRAFADIRGAARPTCDPS